MHLLVIHFRQFLILRYCCPKPHRGNCPFLLTYCFGVCSVYISPTCIFPSITKSSLIYSSKVLMCQYISDFFSSHLLGPEKRKVNSDSDEISWSPLPCRGAPTEPGLGGQTKISWIMLQWSQGFLILSCITLAGTLPMM